MHHIKYDAFYFNKPKYNLIKSLPYKYIIIKERERNGPNGIRLRFDLIKG